ncbi:MAG: ABC transporter permease [Chloroflexi bacterium]|nr:ABC transporter permease [Chloroflexota bacterium]
MGLLWQGFVQAFGLILQGDAALVEIVARSLVVSGSATALAAFVGVPAGAALSVTEFRGKRLAGVLVNTGLGLPPVVVGLVVTIFLWRTGPFGSLQLLYTPTAMIVAQFVVAAPIAAGFTRAALDLLDPDLAPALRVAGASEWRVMLELVRAARAQVLVAVAAAFGRAIAEVGASLMVGGNLLGETRVLTTAMVLETSRGDFALALALGIILLALSLAVNAVLALGARSRP